MKALKYILMIAIVGLVSACKEEPSSKIVLVDQELKTICENKKELIIFFDKSKIILQKDVMDFLNNDWRNELKIGNKFKFELKIVNNKTFLDKILFNNKEVSIKKEAQFKRAPYKENDIHEKNYNCY